MIAAFTTTANASSIVRSASGATARVSAAHAGKFQCLVSALDRSGYKIDFMGGWRSHGSVARSKHPMGLALDINQTGRNRVTRRLPASTTAMASRCGLFHGALWRSADAGHFEVGGRPSWRSTSIAYGGKLRRRSFRWR